MDKNRSFYLSVAFLLVLSVFLAACGSNATPQSLSLKNIVTEPTASPASKLVEWKVENDLIPKESLANIVSVRLQARIPYVIKVNIKGVDILMTYKYLPDKESDKVIEFSIPKNFPDVRSAGKTFQAHTVGAPYVMHFIKEDVTLIRHVFGRFSQFTSDTVLLEYFKGEPLQLK